MTAELEFAVRSALFRHLDKLINLSADGNLNWRLTESFEFDGRRIAMRQVRGRGICKPSILNGAISITTAFTPFGRQPPYEDLEGPDGFPRYKYEGVDPDIFTNRSLRVCLEQGLPLVYFVGVREGTYKPIYPIFVIDEDPQRCEFTLWFSRIDSVRGSEELSHLDRRYVMRETRQRLHQPIFRERVLEAYGEMCTVCQLHHSELLDAAHIVGDSEIGGDPVVPNGLALCKIHHAAYDRNLMGIRPSYEVVINSELLQEIDGPMLKHCLQEMHGRVISVPHRKSQQPDRNRLELRFEDFLRVS